MRLLQSSFIITMRSCHQINFPILLPPHSHPHPLFILVAFRQVVRSALCFMPMALDFFSLLLFWVLKQRHQVKLDFLFTFPLRFQIFQSLHWFSSIIPWLPLLRFGLFSRSFCLPDSVFFLCFKALWPALPQFIFTFFNCVRLTLPRLKSQNHHLPPLTLFWSVFCCTLPKTLLGFIFWRVQEFLSWLNFIWECWVLKVQRFVLDWIWGANPWRRFHFGDERY